MKVTIELTSEQIQQIASEVSGEKNRNPEDLRDINEVFPRLGYAGESRVTHTGAVNFGDDEERVYLVPTADKEGARLSFSLGSISSNLGTIMALNNGAGLFVETLGGKQLTVAPNRTDVILSEKPFRQSSPNFGGNNPWNKVTFAEPYRATPGEPLVLRLVRGNKLNDAGAVTFSFRSL